MDFLIRYEEEGDDMLSGIVTGEETWVSHITSESKQQPQEWRHTSFPVKVKAKQTLSKRKVMATVFWDLCSFLLVDIMPDQLRCLLRNSTEAPKNIAKQTHLKHSPRGKHFNDNEEVKPAVNSLLSDQAAEFFEEDLQNIVLRCWQEWVKSGRFQRHDSSGRSRATSDREDRLTVRSAVTVTDSSLSAVRRVTCTRVSNMTIHRRLIEQNLCWCRPQCSLLTVEPDYSGA
ncbi:histone-lysine N-methyltransferase SETMAR [Trichonephila clavipes]|nr:histone-lysine N-methyltransferase SETMAR [Trichonephila clavipes]